MLYIIFFCFFHIYMFPFERVLTLYVVYNLFSVSFVYIYLFLFERVLTLYIVYNLFLFLSCIYFCFALSVF